MDYAQAWDQQGGFFDLGQGSNFGQPLAKTGYNEAPNRIPPPTINDGQKADEVAFTKDMETWGWLCEDEMLQYQKPIVGSRQIPHGNSDHGSEKHCVPQFEGATQDLTENHMMRTAMFEMRPQSSPHDQRSHDPHQNQSGWQHNLHATLETHFRQGLQRLGASTDVQEQAVVVSRQFHQCIDDWLRQPRGRTFRPGLLGTARSRPNSDYSQQTFSSLDTASFMSTSQSSQKSFDPNNGASFRRRGQAQARPEYACTCCACAWTSKTPYEWRRHEASHHGPWICMPNGSHLVGDYCAICGARDTSDRHRRTHSKLDHCVLKQISERSFRGIDKLMDHLKSHLSDDSRLSQACQAKRKEMLESWYDTPQLPLTALWCGFCQTYLPNWTQRQEHVLAHIKDGRLKVEWMTEREAGNEMEL